RAGRRIGPQVGQLGVVDDEKVRPVFADEIRPSSLERPLEPVIVRHDATPVREGHRAVAGVRRRSLAAEDRHLVSRCEAREELPEVRPDPAPDSPEFRGRHRDLRFLVPPVLGCVNQCSAQDLASLTSRNPNPPAPRASMRRAALLRWKIFSAPLFESSVTQPSEFEGPGHSGPMPRYSETWETLSASEVVTLSTCRI